MNPPVRVIPKACAMSKPTFRRAVRWFLALACVVGWPMLAAQAQRPAARGKATPASGGHQQFPPDHLAFRFDLPASWTVDRGNED